jgi:hypothetical protein
VVAASDSIAQIPQGAAGQLRQVVDSDVFVAELAVQLPEGTSYNANLLIDLVSFTAHSLHAHRRKPLQ